MTVEVPTELDQSSETPTSEQPRITIMPFMGEGDEIVGNVIYSALAGGRRDWYAFAFLANSSRREDGAPEGIEINVDSALSDRVKIDQHGGENGQLDQARGPDARILLGLWSLPTEGAARWIRRIKESSGSALYTSIEQAIRGIVSLVPQLSDEIETHAEK
jgi:hypothetical protein